MKGTQKDRVPIAKLRVAQKAKGEKQNPKRKLWRMCGLSAVSYTDSGQTRINPEAEAEKKDDYLVRSLCRPGGPGS